MLHAIVSVPVGIFNPKMSQAVHGTKCTGLSILKVFVLLYNITFARKLAHGKSIVFNVMLPTCLLLFVFRVISIALVSLASALVVYSSLVMIVCIAIYCILYIVNCMDFCRMFSCGLVVTLCGVVVTLIGYYMLSTRVLGYFRSVEDAVSGRFGG